MYIYLETLLVLVLLLLWLVVGGCWLLLLVVGCWLLLLLFLLLLLLIILWLVWESPYWKNTLQKRCVSTCWLMAYVCLYIYVCVLIHYHCIILFTYIYIYIQFYTCILGIFLYVRYWFDRCLDSGFSFLCHGGPNGIQLKPSTLVLLGCNTFLSVVSMRWFPQQWQVFSKFTAASLHFEYVWTVFAGSILSLWWSS